MGRNAAGGGRSTTSTARSGEGETATSLAGGRSNGRPVITPANRAAARIIDREGARAQVSTREQIDRLEVDRRGALARRRVDERVPAIPAGTNAISFTASHFRKLRNSLQTFRSIANDSVRPQAARETATERASIVNERLSRSRAAAVTRARNLETLGNTREAARLRRLASTL